MRSLRSSALACAETPQLCGARRGLKQREKQQELTIFLAVTLFAEIFFLPVRCISEKVLKNIIAHFKTNGVGARRHGLSQKLPHNTLSLEEIRQVVNFITNFSEANAIILPGRQPYGWKMDCKLLPTNCTKKHVFDMYIEEINKITTEYETAQPPNASHSSQPSSSTQHSKAPRAVKYSTFVNLWDKLLPFMTNLKPATDLCWYCQQRSVQMQRCVNLQSDKKDQGSKGNVESSGRCCKREIFV